MPAGNGIILLLLLNPLAFVVVNWPAIFAWGDGALKFVFEPATRSLNVVQCADDAGCGAIWPIVFFIVALCVFGHFRMDSGWRWI